MASEQEIYPRQLIYRMTQRWPILVAWLSLGFFIGWLISWVWPAPYQARTDLYISINTDAIYRNPDDYKNTLLRQLSALVVTDDFLETTLEQLRYQDTSWNEFNVEDLRPMVEPSWRDTGRWALIVRANDETQAEQIAAAWRMAILEKISAIAPHTRDLLALDTRMEDLAQSLRMILQRESMLTQVDGAYQDIRQDISRRQGDLTIDHLTRWRLYALFVNAADQNDVWMSLMDHFPGENALPGEYIPWMDDVLLTIDIDKEFLQELTTSLEKELDEVTAKQSIEFEAARGLSAHLTIEPLDGDQVTIQSLRPTAASTIIGGLVALLGWIIYFLAGLFIKRDRRIDELA